MSDGEIQGGAFDGAEYAATPGMTNNEIRAMADSAHEHLTAHATFGPAEYVVPDVVAVGEYEFPCCGSSFTFPTSTWPLPSMRFGCPCGNTVELLPPEAGREPT